MTANRATLLALASRVEAATCDNALDVLVEIAMFKPTTIWKSVRANHAETKVIYTDINGKESTFRANDWTMPECKADTAASLRAIAGSLTDD